MSHQPQLFNLNPSFGLIQIQGSDASKFLQGLLTCDMQWLETKDHCFGAFCNLKGRIRALFRVFKQEEVFYLFTPRTLIPIVIPSLKKHAMFSKITIEDVSEYWSLWGVIGVAKDTLINSLNTLENINKISLLTLDEILPRFILAGPENFVPFQNTGKLQDNNISITRAECDAWQLLDIRGLIPQVWAETTEKFLPHHLNLPALNAVSFTKGCYCGQEIIARMEYKGKIKLGLQHRIQKHISNESPISAGSDWAGGVVVSVSQVPNGDIECLLVANTVKDELPRSDS